MNKKILLSTFLVAMFMTIITLLLITAFMYPVLEDEIMSELDTELSMLSLGLEQGGTEYLENLQDIHRQIMLVSSDGTILYSNDVRLQKGENISHFASITDALEMGEGKSIKYSRKWTKQRVAYAQRLPDGTVLRISARKDSIVAILQRLLWPMLVILAGTACLSIVLSRVVTKDILRPINKLDLEHPTDNQIYKELCPLLERMEKQNDLLRKSMEEEMQERESKQSEFIANLSHEMKTPLTSISGFAELMKGGELPTETIQDFSGAVYDEANRLLLLANDIIKLSMIENNDFAYEWEDIEIYALCEEIWMRLMPGARKYKISLTINGVAAVIRGVRRIVFEMIYNIVDNAIKYNRKNGRVEISVRKEDSHITVQVEDTGIGIPEEEQTRIFERFYRVDKSRSRAVDGTGLGLSIVKHGALLHHAAIHVESNQREGTLIALEFPVEQEEEGIR